MQPSSTQAARPSRLGWGIAAGLLLLWVTTLARNAWLCDDAYISFRTIHNFVLGEGLRWNVADRVQVFTHPLWLLLVSGIHALTHEFYLTVLWLSGTVSVLAVAVLALAVARTATAACVVLTALLFSRSFVEFSTSGLENPLTHLLVAAYAWVWFGADRTEAHDGRRFRWLCAIAAAACNRLDLGALLAPSLLCAAWALRWKRAFALAVPGAVVLLAWLAFATLYYGTPFPITAYAKAFCTGVPRADLWAQSVHYFADLFANDTITGVVLVLGLAAPILDRRAWPLAAGVAAYLVYVVHIGGDFMSGRMFAAPFTLAVAVLARGPLPTRPRSISLICIALAGLGMVGSTPAPFAATEQPRQQLDADGISNERRFYLLGLGAWSSKRSPPVVGADWLRANLRERPVVVVRAGVGVPGFQGGDFSHVVDYWLCDPLVARLPIAEPGVWRIGHFQRRLPEGYLETLATGTNRIRHPGLARYYDTLAATTREPVFAGARLAAVWRLLSGAADADLADFLADDYYEPPTPVVRAADVAEPRAVGTAWHEEDMRVVYAGGIEVRFDGPQRTAELDAGLDWGDTYELVFRSGEDTLDTSRITTEPMPLFGGMQRLTIPVPKAASQRGFDSILVRQGGLEHSLDGVWALGHLRAAQ